MDGLFRNDCYALSMKTSDKQFIIAIGVIVIIIAAAIGAYTLWSGSNERATANANNASADGVVADQDDADTEPMDDVEGSSDDVAEAPADEEIDTSDWLTYTNEEYGFSFKYSQLFHIIEIEDNRLFRDKDHHLDNVIVRMLDDSGEEFWIQYYPRWNVDAELKSEGEFEYKNIRVHAREKSNRSFVTALYEYGIVGISTMNVSMIQLESGLLRMNRNVTSDVNLESIFLTAIE